MGRSNYESGNADTSRGKELLGEVFSAPVKRRQCFTRTDMIEIEGAAGRCSKIGRPPYCFRLNERGSALIPCR